MSKRILLILGIIVIVGIAFLLIWNEPAITQTGERAGFSIKDYLPFGNSQDSSNLPTENNSNEPEQNYQNNGNVIPRLRKLSSEPVSGAVIFNQGTTSVVRFVEKGTGNVYEARSDSNNITRLTNTTIPKIIRSFWLKDGSGFLAQTIIEDSESVETRFVKLSKAQNSTSTESLTPFTTKISNLPIDIKEIAVRGDSAKIFYYTIERGYSYWYLSNPDGTGASLIATNPLTEWSPKWVSDNMLYLTNKGSYASEGFIYSFNTQNKSFQKIYPGAFGISSTPNKDGSKILISSGASAQTSVFDVKYYSSTDISIKTLAEKCVISKENFAYCGTLDNNASGKYPDDWYKGVVHTEDSLQKIDLINDLSYKISDLSKESNQKIDVVDIDLSNTGDYLIFRNKIDGFLWMLQIEN